MGKLVIMGRRIVPGDIIFCDRMLGTYAHFGIYIGKLKVIHFDSSFIDKVTGYKSPRIAKTTIEKFRDGDTVYTIQPQELLSIVDDYCAFDGGKYNFFSPEETVARAKNCLDNPDYAKYHLMDNNCEHFALWCKTGIRDSSQTRNIKRGTSNSMIKYNGKYIAKSVGNIIPTTVAMPPNLYSDPSDFVNSILGPVGVILTSINRYIFRVEAEY